MPQPIALKGASLALVDVSLGDDDNNEEPLRLLELPGKVLLAYGGDDGRIAARSLEGTASSNDFKVIHRCDDMVRAVACSSDGKRIAVGLSDGSTTIYTFDNYDGIDNLWSYVPHFHHVPFYVYR